MVTHINTLNMISSTVLGIRIHCYAWHTAKNELSKRGNLVATLGSTLYSVSGIGMLSITSGPSSQQRLLLIDTHTHNDSSEAVPNSNAHMLSER